MLAEFFEKTRSANYGPLPCAFWAADGVHHATGFDPISDLRGRNLSWIECRHMLIEASGLVGLVSSRMTWSGFREMDGDGVAVLKLGRQRMCGFVQEGRAIVKTKTGQLVSDEFTVLRGWSWHRP